MNTIEHYTEDYDTYEDVLNGGMNGKTFVNLECIQLETNTLDEALQKYADLVNELVIYYQQDGVQMFKRFKL